MAQGLDSRFDSGWSLSLPSIARKPKKRLPRYVEGPSKHPNRRMMRLYYPASDIKYGSPDPAKMCGEGRMEQVHHGPEEPQLRAVYVRFGNGAHTKWHYHTGTQLLLGVEGVGFVDIQGLPRFALRERDRVIVPAGVWHRRGAEDGQDMIHLAITTGVTEWDKKDRCGIQE